MIAVLGGLADVERDLIRTRTAEGRSRAKARGQHMGRPPALTRQQQAEARQRREYGATLQELAASMNDDLELIFIESMESSDYLSKEVPQMKKLLILFVAICGLMLATQPLGRAQGVSFGIPLPFPFLFYNFGPTYYAQLYYGAAYYPRPYYVRPVRYYRPAYHYRYYGYYYRPRYYRPAYYGPGWYGY
jgi:hypothetical protein